MFDDGMDYWQQTLEGSVAGERPDSEPVRRQLSQGAQLHDSLHSVLPSFDGMLGMTSLPAWAHGQGQRAYGPPSGGAPPQFFRTPIPGSATSRPHTAPQLPQVGEEPLPAMRADLLDPDLFAPTQPSSNAPPPASLNPAAPAGPAEPGGFFGAGLGGTSSSQALPEAPLGPALRRGSAHPGVRACALAGRAGPMGHSLSLPILGPDAGDLGEGEPPETPTTGEGGALGSADRGWATAERGDGVAAAIKRSLSDDGMDLQRLAEGDLEEQHQQYLTPAHKRKGKGGRQPAPDPRNDPSIDPKKAKRILANRMSAARSKAKQKSHVDSLRHKVSQLSAHRDKVSAMLANLNEDIQRYKTENTFLASRIHAQHLRYQQLVQQHRALLEQCNEYAARNGMGRLDQPAPDTPDRDLGPPDDLQGRQRWATSPQPAHVEDGEGPAMTGHAAAGPSAAVAQPPQAQLL